MVRSPYSVVRPILWYGGNPQFSREIINKNVNTSKRALLFTNTKKCGKSRCLSIIQVFILMTNILTLVKYFNTTEPGSPMIMACVEYSRGCWSH